MVKRHKQYLRPKSSKGFVIAIDGPVASGKGTISKMLAKKLEGVCFYTGGMYRALALKCIREKIDFNDEEKVLDVLENTIIELKKKIKSSYSRVYLDGNDVTDKIFNDDVAQVSSIVSQLRGVRDYMVAKQRDLALTNKMKGKIVIMEGRDMGTRVVADADLKIFLTADVGVRAKRRQKQYQRIGVIKPIDEVVSEIEERDKRDKQRAIDPLISKPGDFGYIVLDSSNLNILETVDKILYLALDKLNI